MDHHKRLEEIRLLIESLHAERERLEAESPVGQVREKLAEIGQIMQEIDYYSSDRHVALNEIRDFADSWDSSSANC